MHIITSTWRGVTQWCGGHTIELSSIKLKPSTLYIGLLETPTDIDEAVKPVRTGRLVNLADEH